MTRRRVRRPYVFSDDELRAIRRRIAGLYASRFVNMRNLVIFDMLKVLGARPAEVCGIRVEEIDWQKGVWYLPGEREKCYNDKVFYLHYSPVLWRFLRWYRYEFAAHIDRDGFLFPSRQHRKYYDSNHYQCIVWRKALPSAGLGQRTWRGRQLYDLRVTCFTRLVVEKHKTAEDIMSLGQWTNFVTPMKYYVMARHKETQAALLA